MQRERADARPPLITRDFALILGATICFFASLNMLNPLFPSFLRERTGAGDATIGLYIGLFSISGIFLRPAVGRALATHARRTFMMIGTGATAVAGGLYLVSRAWAFLVPLRLAHGIAIAAFYTAASTLVADTAPESRRGEALSYFSMCLYVGLAGGPALALALRAGPGFPSAFFASCALGVVGVVLAFRIHEPSGPHTAIATEIERHPLINRAALYPAAVLTTSAVGYAAVLAFSADFAEQSSNPAKTAYFPVLALSVIAVRMVSGRLADRFGRLTVALPGLALFCGAVALQGGARTGTGLLIAGALGGIGFGCFFPSMLAYTVDRVRPVERGSAMATLTGAFDLGFGLGAPILGAIKQATDYPGMYRAAAAFGVAGVLMLGLKVRGERERAGT